MKRVLEVAFGYKAAFRQVEVLGNSIKIDKIQSEQVFLRAYSFWLVTFPSSQQERQL